MPNKRDDVLIGISEFGAVVGGTDVPWGETEEDGIEWGAELTKHDVRSGQSKAKRKSFVTGVDMTLTTRLQNTNLANVRDTFGLPSSALTGDLDPATGSPTAEILEINAADIGTEEFHLYAIGMGPLGPRRVEWPVCTVKTPPKLKMASTGHTMLDVTWDVLQPVTSTPLATIEDAP